MKNRDVMLFCGGIVVAAGITMAVANATTLPPVASYDVFPSVTVNGQPYHCDETNYPRPCPALAYAVGAVVDHHDKYSRLTFDTWPGPTGFILRRRTDGCLTAGSVRDVTGDRSGFVWCPADEWVLPIHWTLDNGDVITVRLEGRHE